MSVDIDWTKLDESLAERIRDLLNRRLHDVPFPSFLHNARITSFEFGTVPPVVEIEDIDDPFDMFYDESSSSSSSSSSDEAENAIGEESAASHLEEHLTLPPSRRFSFEAEAEEPSSTSVTMQNPTTSSPGAPISRHQRSGSTTLSDVPSHTTSLPSYSEIDHAQRGHTTGTASFEAAAANSNLDQLSRPMPHRGPGLLSYFHPNIGFNGIMMGPSGLATPRWTASPAIAMHDDGNHHPWHDHTSGNERRRSFPASTARDRFREDVNTNSDFGSNNDIQIVARVTYDGDLRIVMMADLMLSNDLSPAFVSLPVKLIITRIKLEAHAAIAYVEKNRVHLTLFDDASHTEATAAVADPALASPSPETTRHILQDMKIESEIGASDKQVLKNVGRIETFLLERFRQILEQELVAPSFYTFVY